MSQLVIVPTPIGNLEDITFRAISTLKEVDFILAEDTRTTKKLLDHYEISNQLISYHIHNEHKIVENIIQKIQTVQKVALVSDAGTPSISDPGFLLVRACYEHDIPVTCLPGASAIIPALAGSGLPCDKFTFEGFLPHKKGRQTRWKVIAEEQRTVVLYESPHRLLKCLNEALEHLGPDREICVVRELSKIHEEYKRGTVSAVKEYYEQHPPKGEIVVILSAEKG